MSCEKERQEHIEAMEAHAAAAQSLKRHEAAMFGGTSPRPVFLSDQDVETLRRLEAEEEETGRLEREKALAYERAQRSHQEQ